MNSNLRLLVDFTPLLGFFIANKLLGLAGGTAVLIVLTLVSLAVVYACERSVALMPLVSGGAVALMGGLTLLLNDAYYIKIKPTVMNLLFATVLLGGVYFRKSTFKYVLGHALSLEDEGWRRLSLRWGLFFLFLAGLNEVVWRNFPTDFWVNFKVFGMFTLSIAFTLAQMPLIRRYWVEPGSCSKL
jgi:intracellular septation protein